jgi:hypothetical protein
MSWAVLNGSRLLQEVGFGSGTDVSESQRTLCKAAASVWGAIAWDCIQRLPGFDWLEWGGEGGCKLVEMMNAFDFDLHSAKISKVFGADGASCSPGCIFPLLMQYGDFERVNLGADWKFETLPKTLSRSSQTWYAAIMHTPSNPPPLGISPMEV